MYLVWASTQFKQKLAKAARELGSQAKPSRFLILCAIDDAWKKGELAFCLELSKVTGVDRSTASEIIRMLHAEHLIDIKGNKDDTRIKLVSLTGQGKALVDRERDIYSAAGENVLSALSGDERTQFLAMFKAILTKEVEAEPKLRIVK